MPSGCYNTTGGLQALLFAMSRREQGRRNPQKRHVRNERTGSPLFKFQSPDLTTDDMFSRKHKEKLFAAIEAITENE